MNVAISDNFSGKNPETKTVAFSRVFCQTGCAGAQHRGTETRNASRLLEDESAFAAPRSLPLADGRTSAVYRAVAGGYQFNLHSYLARFEDRFWAIWSSGLIDEDSPEQIVRYATSEDGHNWGESTELTGPPQTPDGPGICIARGIFVHRGRLTALIAFLDGDAGSSWEERGAWPTGWPERWINLRLMEFRWSRVRWEEVGVFLDDAMNNFPPRKLGNRLFMTARNSYVKLHTALSETSDGGGWTRTILPGDPPHDFLTECSWYVDPDGRVHLLGRDDRCSKCLYHSISTDDGKTWTAPVRTNYPDALSKNLAGRLSNGTYFLINNPVRDGFTVRDPLSISFSSDGWSFGRPKNLRANAPPQRFAGRAKDADSFQYPHALEHAGSLWVIYSTNKEDIEIGEYDLEWLVPS